MSESYYKKQKEILNLKNILFNLKNKSLNLHSRIQIMQDIFKTSKNIISQKITRLIKIDSNPKTSKAMLSQKQSIYNEIISDLESIKNKYSLKEKIDNLKSEIIVKSRNIQEISKRYNYLNLLNEKNFLTYTIQEKKNIYENLKKRLDIEIKLEFLLNPQCEIYLDNFYDLSSSNNFNCNITKEQLLNTKYLKKINKEVNIENDKNYSNLNTYLTELKDQKIKEDKEYQDFIKKHQLKCIFNNNNYCQQYVYEIEPIIDNNNYNSSDSDDSEESDSDETKYYFNYDNDKKSNTYSFNSKIKKKISDLSNKETSYKTSLDHNGKKKNKINLNKNNVQTDYLISELVSIKEKYNKLIQEKYDLENQKKIKYQKILEIKSKIKKMDFLDLPMEFNSDKIEKHNNSLDTHINEKNLSTYKID